MQAIEAACPNGVAKVVDGKITIERCSADIVVAVSENVRSIQLQMVFMDIKFISVDAGGKNFSRKISQ